VSDGAAAVLLMKRKTAKALKLKILGTFRGFKVEGCQPDEMGVGPAVAIPSLLRDVGLTVKDVDVFEINEAFASQAAYCVKKLGIPMDKLNPNGGGIALGHPLGCTGARQIATLLWELQRTKKRTGVVSMCIGTGMGAAGLFEAE
jgi:acetyl-CoA acyltransferase 1